MAKMPHWSELKFKPQWRDYTRHYDAIDVSAVDTETLPSGDVRVIASPYRVVVVENFEDVMGFLTTSNLEGKAVFLYNLRFDVEAIMRYNKDAQLGLAYEGEYEDNRYKLEYIPERKLSIKRRGRSHRGSVNLFDLMQYYQGGLEKNAEKYLGLPPRAIKEERANLFKLHTTEEIMEYCREDARRTAELGRIFVDGFARIGFYPRSFISSGTLAADYCMRHAEIPMTFKYLPYKVGRAYYQAYRGGWFELFKRGKELVYAYDIVSAYPYALRRLPDIRDGLWVPFDERLEYGVVKVKIKRSLTDLNPLGFRTQKGMYYPDINEPVLTWITAREYRAFQRYYDMVPVKEDNYSDEVGWSFKPFRELRRPFEEVVDHLFEIKKRSVKGTPEYMAVKTIMNAIYGKTIEKRTETGEWITGQMFNPFYAAEITATPRVMIADAVYGRRDDLIMISTDSIHSTKPLNVPTGHRLGEWTIEAEGKEGIYLFNGIYTIKGISQHMRGFNKGVDLFELLDTDAEEVEIKLTHVKHAREAYRQGKMVDVATFGETIKKVTILPDVRHVWMTRPKTLRELLTMSHESLPIPSALIELEEPDDKTYDLQDVWKV